jgi:protein-S-isoprenylcysteine O-methyltransferase Ste14
MSLSQHWLVLLLALLGSGCLYGIAWPEDRELVVQLGPAYQRYTQKVPRMNLVAGLLRILRRAEPK